VAGASLIPWAAFLAAIALTGIVSGDESMSIGRVVAVAPFDLAVVALPSALALAAARARATRVVALIVRTTVSAIAGVIVTASEEAQAGLAMLWVPYVALPLAAALWVGHAVAASRTSRPRPPDGEAAVPATPSDRLAALAVDVAIVGAALVVPLTLMSHAKHEVAATVVGVAVATAYFAGFGAARGQTLGQSLLGLSLVDAQSMRRPTLSRAVLRSLVIVLEVAAVSTIVLSPPAIAELVSVVTTGRSLTDRLLRTRVVNKARTDVSYALPTST